MTLYLISQLLQDKSGEWWSGGWYHGIW